MPPGSRLVQPPTKRRLVAQIFVLEQTTKMEEALSVRDDRAYNAMNSGVSVFFYCKFKIVSLKSSKPAAFEMMVNKAFVVINYWNFLIFRCSILNGHMNFACSS